MTRVDLLARSAKPSLDVFDRADANDAASKKDALAKVPAMGGVLSGRLTNVPLPAAPVGSFTLAFDDRGVDDVWMLVTWSDE